MFKEFFDCYSIVSNIEEYGFEPESSFLSNDDLNELFNDSSFDESGFIKYYLSINYFNYSFIYY